MWLRLGAGLLGQDEDLHDEYAAEYEAGAGDVVLERWQRGGSVLLRRGQKLVKRSNSLRVEARLQAIYTAAKPS